MELLDTEEERVMASYFHSQSELHALAESLKLEFVRNWPSDRKLRLWEIYEKCEEDTLTYAQKAKEVLEKRKQGRFPGILQK